MKSRKTKICWAIAAALMGFGVFLGTAWVHQFGKVHQHCIVGTSIAFKAYSVDHDGALPYSTNGFGDALLLLVKGDYLPNVANICGPGDDGHVLSNALVRGLHVPEEQCSRVYIQGLNETNDPCICVFFDRRSVPGGDHNYGHGKPLREVCLLDGSMHRIPDEEWPEFSRRQVELLRAAGFSRQKALEYFPDAAIPR
jgi:hypothetical protein